VGVYAFKTPMASARGTMVWCFVAYMKASSVAIGGIPRVEKSLLFCLATTLV
jgi:hypothetical protein